MANKLLHEVVLIHVAADGPVSFASILAYVHQQYNGQCPDYILSICLTALIREGKLSLYDDGVSFTTDRIHYDTSAWETAETDHD